MKSAPFALLLLLLAAAGFTGFAGCVQKPKTAETAPLTFQRGAQLLAAGSPKSAIPFLTQTVAAAPDGPEPVALLSLAYALDLQDERALLEAHQVHRPKGSPPGWELIAVGIAQMTRHQPELAITTFQRQLAGDLPDSPIAPAARQWLAMAQILAGHHDQALETLALLGKTSSMQVSSLLWTAVIHLQHGRTAEAAEVLAQCAKLSENSSGQAALQRNLTQADDQTLYDAAIAAIAAGDLDLANGLFARVRDHNADASDTAVWMALIAGIKHDWQSVRSQLKTACETGTSQPRGLANQLFSVICAIEDRPDAMIQYMLTGQRMLGRNAAPAYVHEQPKPEGVWGADYMK